MTNSHSVSLSSRFSPVVRTFLLLVALTATKSLAQEEGAGNATNSSSILTTGTESDVGITGELNTECDVGPDALSLEYAQLPQTCITVEGQQRCWYTYTPSIQEEGGGGGMNIFAPNSTVEKSNHDDSKSGVPLVIDMHGYTGCATFQVFYTGWMEKALQDENGGFVLVVPQGTTNISVADLPCWDAGECCCHTCTAADPVECIPQFPVNETEMEDIEEFPIQQVDVPDVAFLRQVMADTVAASPVEIDTTRIYLAGHSNGCMMAQRLAAELSDMIAAVCCHAGVLMGVDVPPNTITATGSASYVPTPVWTVHGDDDTIVNYYGGTTGPLGEIASAEDNLATWAKANQCSDYKLVNDTSGMYATHVYSGCYRNTTVEMVQLFGVGHFPYKETNVPNISETDIDTTQLAKEFCFKYRSEQPAPLPPATDSGLGVDVDENDSALVPNSSTTTTPPVAEDDSSPTADISPEEEDAKSSVGDRLWSGLLISYAGIAALSVLLTAFE